MHSPEPVHESGAIARSIAALCRHYHIPRHQVKLELTFSEDAATYRLYGKDADLNYFEEKGATYEQAQLKANQHLAARYASKMSEQRHAAEATTAAKVAAQPAYEKATADQKQEIIRLLNHPLITRQEKTKMLLSINKLAKDRAEQSITKLKAAITDRQGMPA